MAGSHEDPSSAYEHADFCATPPRMTDAAEPPVTFRDFASQTFAGDVEGATQSLVVLLALSHARARAAAERFKEKTADPTFLPRAMSLRTAVEGTDEAAIAALLVECFGLADGEAASSTAALRARYAK